MRACRPTLNKRSVELFDWTSEVMLPCSLFCRFLTAKSTWTMKSTPIGQRQHTFSSGTQRAGRHLEQHSRLQIIGQYTLRPTQWLMYLDNFSPQFLLNSKTLHSVHWSSSFGVLLQKIFHCKISEQMQCCQSSIPVLVQSNPCYCLILKINTTWRLLKRKKWAVLYSTLHMQLTQILKNC